MDLYKWEVNGSWMWSTLGSEWTLALAPNSWWYLTVTLMTFSSGRQGPHVTPIRRTTPLQSARRAVKEPQPQPFPANLGMNYWKGQSWAPPWRKMELAERSKWQSFRTRGKGHFQHHVHLSYVSSDTTLIYLKRNVSVAGAIGWAHGMKHSRINCLFIYFQPHTKKKNRHHIKPFSLAWV